MAIYSKSLISILSIIGAVLCACSDNANNFDFEQLKEFDNTASSLSVQSSSSEDNGSSSSLDHSYSSRLDNSSSSSVQQITTLKKSCRQEDIENKYKDDPRVKNFRLLYVREDGILDTAFFPFDECRFNDNCTFSCKQRQCWEDVGGGINVYLRDDFYIHLIHLTADQREGDFGAYFRSSTEKSLLIDINLGDSALTDYIPGPQIPMLRTGMVRNALSKLPSKSCTTLKYFSGDDWSNDNFYKLESIGLPEGIFIYCNSEHSENVRPYTLLFPKEKMEMVQKDILDTSWLVADYETRFERDEIYRNLYYEYDEFYYGYEYFYYDEIEQQYSISVNEFGCGELSHSYKFKPVTGPCQGWSPPVSAKEFRCRLLNTSDRAPTGTIQWKLVYRDQFNRGDTIDITTTFSK